VTMLVLGVFIPIVQATNGAAASVRSRVLVDVYVKSSATAAVPAKIHQPRTLHQSPCTVPGTRSTNATPLPVRSALAGQRRTCWRRAAIATSSTAQVASEMRICAIESWKWKPTCPITCSEVIVAARCRRGSLNFGSTTGYVVPPTESVRPPEAGAALALTQPMLDGKRESYETGRMGG